MVADKAGGGLVEEVGAGGADLYAVLMIRNFIRSNLDM